MDEKRKIFSTTVNDIDFKMIREGERSWIKIVPSIQMAHPSILHLILNDEYYNWEIYDKEGRESHEVYFEGLNTNPNFYLQSKEDCFKISFDANGVKINPINEEHTLDKYLKTHCSCNSSDASCWAKAVYYTSRPDKYPFNEM